MNDYLKSAAKRYYDKFKKEFLINPISNTDAEIVTEIIELFKKLKGNEAAAILKEYKYKKDEEIRDSLLDLNTNFKQSKVKIQKQEENFEDQPEEGEESKSNIIYFNDYQQTFIKKYFVLGGKKIVFVDKQTGAQFPAILLNEVDELATKKPMYSNQVLMYNEEEERDEDFENLISIMK